MTDTQHTTTEDVGNYLGIILLLAISIAFFVLLTIGLITLWRWAL